MAARKFQASSDDDARWMRRALSRARVAARKGEVPVGCVIVREGKLFGSGYNVREGATDPTAHAEIVALRRAAKKAGDWRLEGATCYVTLEPCLMCIGALKNARVARLVFGAADPKQGASRLARKPPAVLDGNDRPLSVEGGVLAAEAATLLKEFFRARRRARS